MPVAPPRHCVLLLQILEEIERHKIRIYAFPECDSDEDDEFKQQDTELKVSLLTSPYVISIVFPVGGGILRYRS